MTTSRPETQWALERETVLTRVIDAPRSRVFAAFMSPAIATWFGPAGFSCSTHEMDLRVGGCWRFDMTAPDGQVWSNRMTFLEVVEDRKLVYEHGEDVDDDPGRFLVTVTFDEQSNGKTVLTMRQLFATVEQRQATVGFGAVELGMQTLDKLVAHLEAGAPGTPPAG